MQEIYISFYLKTSRIHIFMNALRRLGNPSRICLMIEENGKALLLAPYKKKNFRSIAVPSYIYCSMGCMEVSSLKLCHIIAGLHHWDLNRSYRVPGRIHTQHNVVIFSLAEAKLIDRLNPNYNSTS